MAYTNLKEVGFVLYHELIHMTSFVVDADIGYGKGPLVELATANAEAARMSANNYMLYAAQNGLSYAEYSEVSTGWGLNVHDPFCTDRYSNCLDIAANCCGEQFTNGWNGNRAREDCCASCTVYDSTDNCIQVNGRFYNDDGHVYNIDTPEGVGSATGPPPPSEPVLVEANGILGCGTTCNSSNECYTGMFCCPNTFLCMDNDTKGTQGISCDIWTREQ